MPQLILSPEQLQVILAVPDGGVIYGKACKRQSIDFTVLFEAETSDFPTKTITMPLPYENQGAV